MTTSNTPLVSDYQSYLAQKEKVQAVKQARVRVGVSWLLHLFTIGPIVSVVYSSKTENWVPFLAATGVAVIGVPVAAIDFGFTLAVAPPITSALLVQTKAGERRRQLGIFGPEQADALMISSFQNQPQVERVIEKTVVVKKEESDS